MLLRRQRSPKLFTFSDGLDRDDELYTNNNFCGCAETTTMECQADGSCSSVDEEQEDATASS